MYKIARNLSLDVAAGAAAMSWMVARFLDQSVPQVYFVLLSLMVWMIYTADHLLDARSIGHIASTDRHRFHQRYFSLLVTAEVLCAILFVWLLPAHIPTRMWYYTGALFAVIVVYFLSLHWAKRHQFRYVFKEVLIAFCYTAGICAAPIAFAAIPLPQGIYFLALRVFFIALANLFLFSLIEHGSDSRDEQPSVIRLFGFKKVRWAIQSLLYINVCVGAIRLFFVESDQQVFVILLLFMDLTLLAIYYFRQAFRTNEWYRVLGDGIFLYPVVIWLYEYLQ